MPPTMAKSGAAIVLPYRGPIAIRLIKSVLLEATGVLIAIFWYTRGEWYGGARGPDAW